MLIQMFKEELTSSSQNMIRTTVEVWTKMKPSTY